MKLYLLILLTLLTISCNVPVSENKEIKDTSVSAGKLTIRPKNVVNPRTIDPINSIRNIVEGINNSDLKTKHFEFMCDEKMLVDYFYLNNEIVRISVDYGTIGDSYAKEDYYFANGKLVFNYEFVEGGPACEGCITKNEFRSYIRNDKVIKYLKNKSLQKCRKCEFDLSSKQYKLLQTEKPEEIKWILCKMR
jgi:hypothetical protein